MWPDWVSNPGPLALETDALPPVPLGLASTLLDCLNVVMLFDGASTQIWIRQEKRPP